MAATIWSKFFWSDWANDPALRLCSLAAQGLWMRCLCIAAESDPTGYVSVNGRPLGVTDIARMVGVTETEAASLIADLERNGVFSRDRNGRIYSRRMVRDAKLQEVARKNGRRGGNPSLRKHNENENRDNPPHKGGHNTHKPEARIQTDNHLASTLSTEEPFRSKNGQGDYALVHGVVHLTAADLARWEKAFPKLSVAAELMSAEPWLAKQKNWFQAAAGLLAKRNREAARGPPEGNEPPPRHPRHGF